MNMCLLEVAMCEKCRSSHFQSGGSKKFEDWGGVKNFKTATGGDLGGGVQYPNTCHAILIFKSRLLSFIHPVQSKDYNVFDPTGLKFLILDFLVI